MKARGTSRYRALITRTFQMPSHDKRHYHSTRVEGTQYVKCTENLQDGKKKRSQTYEYIELTGLHILFPAMLRHRTLYSALLSIGLGLIRNSSQLDLIRFNAQVSKLVRTWNWRCDTWFFQLSTNTHGTRNESATCSNICNHFAYHRL